MESSVPLSAMDSFALQKELSLLSEKIAVLKEEIATGRRVELSDSSHPSTLFFLHSQVSRLAAAGETEELKEVLSKQGIDLNSIRVSDDRTPLHLAAMGGHSETVDLLLSAGMELAATDYDGNRADELALAAGHTALAARLKAILPEVPIFFALSPTMLTSPPSTNPSLTAMHDFKGFVVLLVGLPGRGKSFVAAQICRYFSWHGVTSRVLTHEVFRVSELGSNATDVTPADEQKVASAIAVETRKLLLDGTGLVVLDSSHALRSRREAMRSAILQITQLNPERFVMVEVVNSSERVLLRNVRRLAPPVTQEELEVYSKRVREEEKVYETLDPVADRHVPYIRLVEEKRVELNNIQGVIPTTLAHLLHNLKQEAPCLYLTDSGEWEDRVNKKFGGDSGLTAAGGCYSLALSEFILREMGGNRFFVMSSTANRSVQTCQQFIHFASADPANNLSQDDISSGFGTSPFAAPSVTFPSETPNGRCRVAFFPTLVDVNYGDCEGQSEETVKVIFPGTLENIAKDPYFVEWPNGESVHQTFTARLLQHIHDIQACQIPTIVVAPKVIIQGLLAYFGDSGGPQCAPHLDVPLHTVFKLTLAADRRREIEKFDLTPRVDSLLEALHQQQLQQQASSPVTREATTSFEM